MKKYTLIIVFCLCFLSMLKSQDIIVMQNGDEIKAKLLEINLDTLKYKMFNNINGPTILILKKDVFMVKFQNGTKQVFEELNEATPDQKQEEAQSDYDKGCNDAHFSYKGNGPMWGTIVATIPLVIPGLITAIVVSSIRPSIRHLKMDNSLIENKDYVKGYRDTAFKIKKRKTWKGFLIVGIIEILPFVGL
jgi:hypothetical protein